LVPSSCLTRGVNLSNDIWSYLNKHNYR
jgi:hypothetical protein